LVVAVAVAVAVVFGVAFRLLVLLLKLNDFAVPSPTARPGEARRAFGNGASQWLASAVSSPPLPEGEGLIVG